MPGKKKKKKPPKSPPSIPLYLEEESSVEDNFTDALNQFGDELSKARFWGQAGGGLVKIEMDGMLTVLECRLAPELLEKKDRELIEDLVVSAVNNAAEKARKRALELMPVLTEEQQEDTADTSDLVKMIQCLSQDPHFLEQLEDQDPFMAAFFEFFSSLPQEEEEEEEKEEEKEDL